MLKLFFLANLIVLLPLLVFGIIISFINKRVAENLHTNSKWWIYTLCGFIGTPIHELSHLIFNLLFLHKVTKVSLYRPIKSKKDGLLGYVEFTYNSNSIYQNIGLFFTGIAPMIGGSVVLFLMMKFMLPDVFSNFQFFEIKGLNLLEILESLKNNIIENFKCVFYADANPGMLALFFVLAFSISTHMSISPADLANAVKGGVLLELILFVTSILMGVYNLTDFAVGIPIIASYMISFFIIGLIFSLISLAVSFVISLIPE